MADSFNLITYEDDGFPVELHSEGDCARAVASGSIRESTRIIVYEPGGRTVRQRADENALFQRLFGTSAPPSVEAVAPPPVKEAEAKAAPPSPWAATAPEPAASIPLAIPAAPPPPPPMATTLEAPEQPPVRVRLRDRAWFLPGLLIILAGVFWLTRESASTGGDPLATSGETVSEATTPIAREADLPQQTLFTVREVNLQSRPTSGDGVGKLARNSEVTGVIVPGVSGSERWMRIREGAKAGLYVWAGNLAASARPVLDTAAAGPHQAVVEDSIRSAPSVTAALVTNNGGRLAAGDTANVAGLVDGNWAELALRGGGVGYVPAASLGIGSASEQIVDAAAAAAAAGAAAVNAAADAMKKAIDTPPRASWGTRHVFVRNQCPYPITLAIYYESSEGWQTSGGVLWRYEANGQGYPAYRGQRLNAASKDIYYRIVEANDERIDNFAGDRDVTYGSRRYSMKRANVVEARGGDYQLDFTC